MRSLGLSQGSGLLLWAGRRAHSCSVVSRTGSKHHAVAAFGLGSWDRGKTRQKTIHAEAKSTNDGFQARPINLLSGSPAYLGTPHPVPLHHRAIPRSNDTRESSLAEEGSNSAALIIGEWQPWLSGRNAALGEKQH